jgi:antirestriction protein ArdC
MVRSNAFAVLRLITSSAGSAPWIKPWSATAGANVPCNLSATRFKVYLVKQLEVHETGDDGTDESRLVPMMREYTVFNVAQCDGLPEKVIQPQPVTVRNKDQRDALADEFMTASKADIREGFGEAYYRPSDDYVSLPPFVSFKSADAFYNTAFHELGHWTGHKSRLDRDLKNRFGDRQYAAEELIAELAVGRVET